MLLYTKLIPNAHGVKLVKLDGAEGPMCVHVGTGLSARRENASVQERPIRAPKEAQESGGNPMQPRHK